LKEEDLDDSSDKQKSNGSSMGLISIGLLLRSLSEDSIIPNEGVYLEI